MSIQTGDSIPAAELGVMTPDGPSTLSTEAVFTGKRVVLFAVPGAFTPTCNDRHLPGFLEQVEALQDRGVDTIACVAVNDTFVMDAWGKATDTGDRILMLSDGNGDFTRALGLEMDASGFHMGERSRRYAAIVEDGKVVYLGVETGPEVRASSADAVVAELDQLADSGD